MRDVDPLVGDQKWSVPRNVPLRWFLRPEIVALCFYACLFVTHYAAFACRSGTKTIHSDDALMMRGVLGALITGGVPWPSFDLSHV